MKIYKPKWWLFFTFWVTSIVLWIICAICIDNFDVVSTEMTIICFSISIFFTLRYMVTLEIRENSLYFKGLFRKEKEIIYQDIVEVKEVFWSQRTYPSFWVVSHTGERIKVHRLIYMKDMDELIEELQERNPDIQRGRAY